MIRYEDKSYPTRHDLITQVVADYALERVYDDEEQHWEDVANILKELESRQDDTTMILWALLTLVLSTIEGQDPLEASELVRAATDAHSIVQEAANV